MPYQENRLSASAIKYLLAISGLCKDGKGVRYGAVYLTDEGREAAALYRTCYDALFIQIKKVVSVDDTACRNAACAALEQVADQMPQLAAQKGAQND